jgi:ubiquinone/menaquinone biosynthesis C-methylase UbiE
MGREKMDKDPYKNTAAIYDFIIGPLNVALKRMRLDLAPPNQGISVLDVGCGTGSDLEQYHQAGCDVYGVDLSPAMLRVARKRLGDSASLHQCDAAQMPFQRDFFDLILATNTLHEIPTKYRSSVVSEMSRVLKRDGRLLLADFSPGPYSFPIGWMGRALILVVELFAGSEHFRNGRDFLKRGGLKGLIKPDKLTIVSITVVDPGTVAFFLLRAT